MFDGVPAEQLHQFIASRNSLPLPLPLSTFPLNHANSSSPNTLYPSFDAYSSHHHHHHRHRHHQLPPSPPLQPPHSHLLHPILHQSSPNSHKHEEKQDINFASINMEIERDRRSIQEPVIDPWSNDEILALLRIRSHLENWCPDFIWEHVSRKLEEVGFERSAEKCREKFEEESRYFNNINYNGSGKNYRFESELEELYQGENPHHHQNNRTTLVEKNQKNVEKPNKAVAVEDDKRGQSLEEDSTRKEYEEVDKEKALEERLKSKKRKRQKEEEKMEMMKGFCVEVVNKLMALQEEMQNKLIEDMVKREKEKVEREEALKKQEMDRMNKELEIIAHEQAIACDRQTSIIEFLKKFTSSSSFLDEMISGEVSNKVLTSNPITQIPSSSSIQAQGPISQIPSSSPIQAQSPSLEDLPISSPRILEHHQNSSSTENPSSSLVPSTSKLPTSSSTAQDFQNPSSSLNTQKNPVAQISSPPQKVQQNPISSNQRDDIGKRWPREEVQALINLRISLYDNGDQESNKEGVKAPLWERISQGMLELGYRRSSKRCKEKWENINKYYRKTKDLHKKRSFDSRTCPYFHQLNNLYKKGTLLGAPQEGQENSLVVSRENHATSTLPPQETSKVGALVPSSSMHVADDHHQGEPIDGKNNIMLQVPSVAFDFEF
ncbi:hypothetical protein UlMin_029411 [Ulmus minor]